MSPPASSAPPLAGPCPGGGGQGRDPGAKLTQDDCMWLGNRLDRMEAARPHGAPEPYQLASGDAVGDVEEAQLFAFEAGVERWWQVIELDCDTGGFLLGVVYADGTRVSDLQFIDDAPEPVAACDDREVPPAPAVSEGEDRGGGTPGSGGAEGAVGDRPAAAVEPAMQQ